MALPTTAERRLKQNAPDTLTDYWDKVAAVQAQSRIYAYMTLTLGWPLVLKTVLLPLPQICV